MSHKYLIPFDDRPATLTALSMQPDLKEMIQTSEGHWVVSDHEVPELSNYKTTEIPPSLMRRHMAKHQGLSREHPKGKKAEPKLKKKEPEPEPELEQWFPSTRVALEFKAFMKRKDVREHYGTHKERLAAWAAYKAWLDDE